MAISEADEPRQNLEIKVRYPDLTAARERLERQGILLCHVEHQRDTYYHALSGRLKLREIEGRQAVLIAYDRPDNAVARISRYRLVPVADPGALGEALGEALGIRGTVEKRREIYLWHNVRIHLDEVTGLGSFVEFEAVLAGDGEQDQSADRLRRLHRLLDLDAVAPEARSYIDLIATGSSSKSVA